MVRCDLPRIVRDYGLQGLASPAEVLPLLVTKDDEAMRIAIPAEVPAVVLRDFCLFMRTCAGDVRRLAHAANQHWNREPTLRYVEEHARIAFGRYVFEIPLAVCSVPRHA